MSSHNLDTNNLISQIKILTSQQKRLKQEMKNKGTGKTFLIKINAEMLREMYRLLTLSRKQRMYDRLCGPFIPVGCPYEQSCLRKATKRYGNPETQPQPPVDIAFNVMALIR